MKHDRKGTPGSGMFKAAILSAIFWGVLIVLWRMI